MKKIFRDFCVVIHAKESSSRLFRKNFSVINSTPLYMTQAINFSELIDRKNIFIDTDSDEIMRIALLNGFSVMSRESKFASNETGGVDLLYRFAQKVDFKYIIQAFSTGPLIDIDLIQKAMLDIEKQDFDSANLMYTEQHYLWKDNKRSYFMNNDEIPNSIDLEPLQIEMPTFYIVNRERFLNTRERVGNKNNIITLSNKLFSKDIDYLEDLLEVKALFSIPRIKYLYNWSEKIRISDPPIIFFDIDGTLTDGYYNSSKEGELFKSFNTFDGIAFKNLQQRGIKIVFVTASKSKKIIDSRAGLFNIDVIYESENKLERVKSYANENGFSIHESMYVGNDINDLDCLFESGFPVCPNNADEEVKKISFVLKSHSSEGVVKEIYNSLLSSKSIQRNEIV